MLQFHPMTLSMLHLSAQSRGLESICTWIKQKSWGQGYAELSENPFGKQGLIPSSRPTGFLRRERCCCTSEQHQRGRLSRVLLHACAEGALFKSSYSYGLLTRQRNIRISVSFNGFRSYSTKGCLGEEIAVTARNRSGKMIFLLSGDIFISLHPCYA